MTKEERDIIYKKEQEGGSIRGIFDFDLYRVEIGAATFVNVHVEIAGERMIQFIDRQNRLWRSTAPYTMVVSKEINEDDEEDVNKDD